MADHIPNVETNVYCAGLSDETIGKLRELRQLNIDSAKGFGECAELIDEPLLKGAFREIADTRQQQADQLATQLAWSGELEEQDGSYLAAFHRSWVKARSAVSSDDVGVVLNEAERGEDTIKDAYENALQEVAESPIRELVATQYSHVKTIHDKVRDLRDTHNG